MNRSLGILTIAGLMSLAGAPALAQQGGWSNSQTVMIQSEGDQSYRLEINDGKVTAQVNGKTVPQSRIKREDGKISILDEDGKVLTSFNVGALGTTRGEAAARRAERGQRRGFVPSPAQAPRAPEAPEAPQPPEPPAAVLEQPRVMVGIRMNEEDGQVVVDDVIDDLPADKAGIEAGDVLKTVDGKKIENSLSLRSIIRDKQPGDKIEVVVERDGEEKKVELELQAFNAERMGQNGLTMTIPALPGQAGPAQDWTTQFRGMGESGGKWAEDARKALEEALQTIKDSPNGKDFRNDAMQALEKAMESLRQAEKDAGSRWRGMVFTPQPGAQGGQAAPGARQFFRLGGNNDELESKMDKLDKQLEKMSKRLDELSKRLDDKR